MRTPREFDDSDAPEAEAFGVWIHALILGLGAWGFVLLLVGLARLAGRALT